VSEDSQPTMNDKLVDLYERLFRMSIRCGNTGNAYFRRGDERAGREWRDCQEAVDGVIQDLRALIDFPESFAVLDSAE
jgi:hypothetical protein